METSYGLVGESEYPRKSLGSYLLPTGPTEITVFTPEVKWAVDGPLNNCTKAVWYDILLPLVALNTNRSKIEHDYRRRAWDAALALKCKHVTY